MNVSYTMPTLPFEGHNVAYQCKGLDQSNIACEYVVNMSTNEKVITEKQNFNTNCWWKGDLSNTVCEYEIDPLTNEQVISEIQNFNNANW